MRSLLIGEYKINCLRSAFLTEAKIKMQHFDNGHLPGPEEHFVDGFVDRLRTVAVLSFLVGVEAAGLAAMVFGAVSLGSWLVA
ncbi:hypothetical protein ASF24_17095 [Methylobacterium sp. Leaf86]|uniref:hypothetical protein n=1 Tax=Methylobacterium sp. Leaf86 TaxID=1736242 RepID=UPI0006F67026|nr:hypothetical protein [Methylobacterium sp. Leaf86]KQO57580.1 hypothetical protein ASF24_17095 [Methylobacterium sp. Leaf86]